jgi:DMSO/TMAO reductase YedYZ molybdopterin-dependent catalytic subunit
VLHAGTIPILNLDRYRFKVSGLVARPLSLTWSELHALPKQETRCDIHCVTRWSRFENVFSGVPVREILRLATPKPSAKFVLIHAAPDYTTNLPLPDLDREDNLLATHHAGEPVTAEHGGPIRLVVPHLYFWKSAKWVTGFELLDEDWPGFWEENGYHMRGDPWAEERCGRADPARMRRGPRR